MREMSRRLSSILGVCGLLFLAGSAVAQETTTEQRPFEIISVDGNTVVYRGIKGVKEITLPDDFKMTIDGKEVGVKDLKPGMKGMATVTTTTSTKPVTVTEVRNAEVLAVAGNSVIVRGKNGNRKFTVDDVNDKNVTIMKDGQKVELSQLRPGDKLTATIITRKPPETVTEQALKSASIASPEEKAAPAPKAAAAPAPAPASEPAASSAPAPAPAPAAAPAAEAKHAHKKLPKTGSSLPLLVVFGALSLAAGVGLRRYRLAR